MNCPTATAPQRTPWERRDERTKPTYWGMGKAQKRKEKWYKCHRGKSMLVGNERGNPSWWAAKRAVHSLEVPDKPVNTHWCSQVRGGKENSTQTLQSPPSNSLLEPVGMPMPEGSWWWCLMRAWWGETLHPGTRHGAKEALIQNSPVLSRAGPIFQTENVNPTTF